MAHEPLAAHMLYVAPPHPISSDDEVTKLSVGYRFISCQSLPWYDIESIIDDWIMMGFLVGNDFIPNLPNMHINHGALPDLYRIYSKLLPSLNGE